MGLTAGLLNPAPFLGVAVFQVLTGAILDRAGRTGETLPDTGLSERIHGVFYRIGDLPGPVRF